MNEYELKINMIAQEMIEFSEGISWFSSLQKDNQKSVLDSFQFLVVLLGIADKRRRTTVCKKGCTHEWRNIKI